MLSSYLSHTARSFQGSGSYQNEYHYIIYGYDKQSKNYVSCNDHDDCHDHDDNQQYGDDYGHDHDDDYQQQLL